MMKANTLDSKYFSSNFLIHSVKCFLQYKYHVRFNTITFLLVKPMRVNPDADQVNFLAYINCFEIL